MMARTEKSEGPSHKLEPSVVDPEPGVRRIIRPTVLVSFQISGGRSQSLGPAPSLRVDVLLVRRDVLHLPTALSRAGILR